jgi:hypothetical protein
MSSARVLSLRSDPGARHPLLSRRGVLLGGASGFCGTHLVIPDGSELHVVTVLSDSELALGAGAHHALLR